QLIGYSRASLVACPGLVNMKSNQPCKKASSSWSKS
ncbi:hypothetical protein D049_3270B, partial [Vibrio parahaemolyticus VPTS-2010]